MPAPDWRSYLVRFHAERAGITEAVLTRAVDGDVDPYRWVAEAVPAGGAVVDVACGSGPLATALGPRWVGLDLSSAELDVARGRAAGRLQRAHAGALPVADGSAAAVVCALVLMLVEPAPVLAEIRRVLAPGGRLVALLPAGGPLTVRDRLRYGRLLIALGVRRLPFPGPAPRDGSSPRSCPRPRRSGHRHATASTTRPRRTSSSGRSTCREHTRGASPEPPPSPAAGSARSWASPCAGWWPSRSIAPWRAHASDPGG